MKNKKVIIIVSVIILVIIAVLIYAISNSKKDEILINNNIKSETSNKEVKNNEIDLEEFIKNERGFVNETGKQTENEKKVYIEKMGEISEMYKGNLPIAKVSVAIEGAINNIFNKAINLNKTELYNFYNKNLELIKSRLHVNSFEDFNNVMNYINNRKIKKAIIVEETTRRSDNTNNILSKIKLTTENNEELYIGVEINEQDNTIYIFIA